MPIDMEANWSSETALMEMPTVDALKNQVKAPIMINVMTTPTNWVQDMETPQNETGVLGKNSGNEKFSAPKGVM